MASGEPKLSGKRAALTHEGRAALQCACRAIQSSVAWFNALEASRRPRGVRNSQYGTGGLGEGEALPSPTS
eukprot:1290528-Prymnesium_polylepis.1